MWTRRTGLAFCAGSAWRTSLAPLARGPLRTDRALGTGYSPGTLRADGPLRADGTLRAGRALSALFRSFAARRQGKQCCNRQRTEEFVHGSPLKTGSKPLGNNAADAGSLLAACSKSTKWQGSAKGEAGCAHAGWIRRMTNFAPHGSLGKCSPGKCADADGKIASAR